mmetsp:Transcript_7045/g.23364  ORF Transcript_7045/g.23364 Transcript_7045/m.23364 type:complete len:331 (-) Transcript_7045:2795-3787(-)
MIAVIIGLCCHGASGYSSPPASSYANLYISGVSSTASDQSRKLRLTAMTSAFLYFCSVSSIMSRTPPDGGAFVVKVSSELSPATAPVSPSMRIVYVPEGSSVSEANTSSRPSVPISTAVERLAPPTRWPSTRLQRHSQPPAHAVCVASNTARSDGLIASVIPTMPSVPLPRLSASASDATVITTSADPLRPGATGSRSTVIPNRYCLPGASERGGTCTCIWPSWNAAGPAPRAPKQGSAEPMISQLHASIHGVGTPYSSVASEGSTGAASSARGASARTVRSPPTMTGTIGASATWSVTSALAASAELSFMYPCSRKVYCVPAMRVCAGM